MKFKAITLISIFLSFAALTASGLAEYTEATEAETHLKASSGVTKDLIADTEESEVSLLSDEAKLQLAQQKLNELYESIDYGTNDRPSFEVFQKGMIGYLNLLSQQKLSDKNILTIIDFSIASVNKRMWVLDLKNKKLLFHDLVAHGKNSGHNMANAFSNISESYQSSLGFYVTANTYVGKHGLSLRLAGQERGFNDKAMARAIVMHGADYVNTSIIKSMGRLGRSFGCPAVSREISTPLIKTVADGTCLFIYHPSSDYLAKSVLLKHETVLDFLLASNI